MGGLKSKYLLLSWFFGILIVAKGDYAKTCSICDSDEHPSCMETGIRPRGCPESYPHCAKIVFKNDEGMAARVVRRCTLSSAHDTCDENERVCYYVCPEDLCNGSPQTLHPNLLIIVFLVFISSFLLHVFDCWIS